MGAWGVGGAEDRARDEGRWWRGSRVGGRGMPVFLAFLSNSSLPRGCGFCFICSCLSLVSRRVVSVQRYPISETLGGEFAGVEQSRRGG